MGVRSSQPKSPNLNKADGHLLEYFRNTFGAGGGANSGPTDAPAGLEATGGIVNDYTEPGSGNAYRAHTFLTSGAFSVSAVGSLGGNVEFLVVAGGGGGGGSRDNYAGQGGGGAGGLITNLPGVSTPAGSPNPSVSLTRSVTFDVAAGGTYPVVVGGGGIGGFYPGGPGLGGNGTNSVLTHTSAPKTITATGGGGGSGATDAPTQVGADGGSGGGGSGYPSSLQAGGAASPNSNPDRQGHPGGSGAPGGPSSSGGGGGGAGGPGEAGLGPGHPRGAKGGLGVELSIAELPLFMQVVEVVVFTLIQIPLHFLHLLQKMAVAVEAVV